MGYDTTNGSRPWIPGDGAVHWLNPAYGQEMRFERQMSHQERNGVRAAYIHKAEHLEERRLMLQWWADFLMQTGRSVSVRLNMQKLTIHWKGDWTPFTHMLFLLRGRAPASITSLCSAEPSAVLRFSFNNSTSYHRTEFTVLSWATLIPTIKGHRCQASQFL